MDSHKVSVLDELFAIEREVKGWPAAERLDSARQDGGKSNWAEVAIGQAALGVLWVVSSGVISPWMVGGRSSAIGSTCM